MSDTLSFEQAFDQYIRDRKVTGWGFRQPHRVKLANGYYAFPCGYYTVYDNGYKLIISGATLGKTAIQEALILDEDDVPVCYKDTEDLRDVNP